MKDHFLWKINSPFLLHCVIVFLFPAQERKKENKRNTFTYSFSLHLLIFTVILWLLWLSSISKAQFFCAEETSTTLHLLMHKKSFIIIAAPPGTLSNSVMSFLFLDDQKCSSFLKTGRNMGGWSGKDFLICLLVIWLPLSSGLMFSFTSVVIPTVITREGTNFLSILLSMSKRVFCNAL